MVIDVTRPTASIVDAGFIGQANSSPEVQFSVGSRGTQADLEHCYDYCSKFYSNGGSAADIESCRLACRDMIRLGIPAGKDGSPFNRIDQCNGGLDRWNNPCPTIGSQQAYPLTDDFVDPADAFSEAQNLYEQAQNQYKQILNQAQSASSAANGGIGAGVGKGGASGANGSSTTDSGSNTTLYVIGGVVVAGLLVYLLTK